MDDVREPFEVMMPDHLREPFENWLTTRGLVMMVMPGSMTPRILIVVPDPKVVYHPVRPPSEIAP